MRDAMLLWLERWSQHQGGVKGFPDTSFWDGDICVKSKAQGFLQHITMCLSVATSSTPKVTRLFLYNRRDVRPSLFLLCLSNAYVLFSTSIDICIHMPNSSVKNLSLSYSLRILPWKSYLVRISRWHGNRVNTMPWQHTRDRGSLFPAYATPCIKPMHEAESN